MLNVTRFIGRASHVLFITGAILAVTENSEASPTMVDETFGTTGSVGTEGVSGAPVVSFQGWNDGSLTAGTPFDLGKFVVGSLPQGASTTYTDTPFTISFAINSLNSHALSVNETPVVLQGWLNGKVTGGEAPDLHVNFNILVANPEAPPPFDRIIPPFRTGDYSNYLTIRSYGDDLTPIQAEINVTQAVPEPGTFAVFACAASLIIGSRRSTRRNRE